MSEFLPQPLNSQISEDGALHRRRQELIGYLQAQVGKALAIPASKVNVEKPITHLGLDSLMLAELRNRLTKELEIDLPIANFVVSPNLQGLADEILPQLSSTVQLDGTGVTINRGQPSAVPKALASCLVPLQPKGNRPPLFLAHPWMGIVWPYYKLATLLGEDRPVYGLQAVGLDDNQKPFNKIEEMAANYCQALQTIQPQGPYYIGGWSLGVWIAFEMARQLEMSGEKVALLALIDMAPPLKTKSQRILFGLKFSYREMLPTFIPDLYKHWQLNRQVFASEQAPFPESAEMGSQSHLPKTIQLWKQLKYRLPALQRMLRVINCNTQAQISYEPQSYQGKVTLLRINKSSLRSNEDTTYGWSLLAREGVETYTIPGTHLNLLTEPYVRDVASQLQGLLR